MTRQQLITLLTDFGNRDSYVGAMKGVIAARAPEARVVDICHEVPPQDVQRAGIIWSEALPFFPPGAVHVAVVDPGVGGRRRILAAEARGSYFLAPDNGLLGYVLRAGKARRVVEVRNRKCFLPDVSSTFHGRDIFAPVAAGLCQGLELESLGPPARSYLRRSLPREQRRRRRGATEARGVVLYVDGFGNAVTNLAPAAGVRLVRLEAGSIVFPRLARSYDEVGPGEALVLVGSSGRIEVAVNLGSAAALLGLRQGDPVRAVWRS
ncbi:MAG TPA: SAM-dependent chlorinase/fluorinase [Planctomycetota bacterium]|nr:SAM-dependent chlorinase/fluorinase [Planctomycetota bacterium]